MATDSSPVPMVPPRGMSVFAPDVVWHASHGARSCCKRVLFLHSNDFAMCPLRRRGRVGRGRRPGPIRRLMMSSSFVPPVRTRADRRPVSYAAVASVRLRAILQYRAAALAAVATQVFWGLLRLMILDGFYRSDPAASDFTTVHLVSYVWLGQALFGLFPMNVDPLASERRHPQRGGRLRTAPSARPVRQLGRQRHRLEDRQDRAARGAVAAVRGRAAAAHRRPELGARRAGQRRRSAGLRGRDRRWAC